MDGWEKWIPAIEAGRVGVEQLQRESSVDNPPLPYGYAKATILAATEQIVPAPQPGAVLVELTRGEAKAVEKHIKADHKRLWSSTDCPSCEALDKLAAALHQQEGEKRS